MKPLNPAEKELLESVDKEEWESIPNISEEIKLYQTQSANQSAKNRSKLILGVNLKCIKS